MLVADAPAPSRRMTMDEIDDGWVLPNETPAEPAEAVAAAPALADSDDRLDLNQAGLGDLCALPGIGKMRAKRILSLRDELGGFKALDDLRGVKGIGDKLLRELDALIRIAGA